MKKLREYADNKGLNDKRDKALVISFIKGDNNAFSSIYTVHVDGLFDYGTSLGFERETVKDAIQDIFIKLYLNKKHLKNIESLRFYLFRMLKNRLLDIFNSLNKEEPIETSELPFLLEDSILDFIIEEEGRLALEQKVNDLLNILTDRQKEAVYLRFLQEMEYDDVANLLDMTAPAVRKLISRAIKRMREEFLKKMGTKKSV